VRSWLNSYEFINSVFIGRMLNEPSIFFQEAKLKSRAAAVSIGAGTSTSSTTSLATSSTSTSTGADADTEETTASEGETDKKDEKWVSVPIESTPTVMATTAAAS